ncbi:hypothetical protein I548_4450 [Mycobacterium intracellulare]|nr:hypothetical protein I548_4450 [Mycobacterium intracellulare]
MIRWGSLDLRIPRGNARGRLDVVRVHPPQAIPACGNVASIPEKFCR